MTESLRLGLRRLLSHQFHFAQKRFCRLAFGNRMVHCGFRDAFMGFVFAPVKGFDQLELAQRHCFFILKPLFFLCQRLFEFFLPFRGFFKKTDRLNEGRF